MMRKTLFLLLFLSLPLFVFSQEKKVVAVIADDKYVPAGTDLSPVIDQFIVALKQSTKNQYRVVDRSSDFKNVVNIELKYQSTGLVDDDQMALIGKQLGADIVCGLLIQYSNTDRDYYFRARMIEVETADILANTYYPNELDDEEPVRSLSRKELQRVSLYLIKNLDFMTAEQQDSWQKKIDEFEQKAAASAQAAADKAAADRAAADRAAADAAQTAAKAEKQRENRINRKALGASMLIPGRGLKLKGQKGGAGYLLGDIALVGGGIGSYYYGKKQLNTIKDKTTEYTAYTNAKEKYDNLRMISYTCYGAAAALYVCNLFHSYLANNKKNNYTGAIIYPTTIQTNNLDLAMGVGVTLIF